GRAGFATCPLLPDEIANVRERLLDFFMNEVGTSFQRADEVIFEEEEDDGQTMRTRHEDPSPITSGVESGRESSSLEKCLTQEDTGKLTLDAWNKLQRNLSSCSVLAPCSCDVVAVGGALEPCGSTTVGAVGSLLTGGMLVTAGLLCAPHVAVWLLLSWGSLHDAWDPAPVSNEMLTCELSS
ncbi:hypothetical protein ACJX0J_009909, partial [Zea mays]